MSNLCTRTRGMLHSVQSTVHAARLHVWEAALEYTARISCMAGADLGRRLHESCARGTRRRAFLRSSAGQAFPVRVLALPLNRR
jgi:hypothetical protein